MAEKKKWSDFITLGYNIFDYLSKGEKTDLNDKEKEEVETAIKYAEHYSSEYNAYVNQAIDSMAPIDKIKFDIKNLQANQKAQFIARFFTGEILKENFNDKLKDVENVETDKREEQEANKQNISKPDKINAEQQSSEKVKEEEKKDALKGRMTRNKGETSTYSNGRGTANFTSQNISLPNFPGETKFQKVAVSNYTTDDPKNSTLIKITTNGNNIATFYTEEGKIFLEIHEINLALTLLLKENVDIKKIPIETLCLDKKMDIQVKGLGKSSRKNAQDKNLGFLFSAYGFQMKTDDNNVIFKNDTPFDIEIDEKFLDIALANELSAEKSDKGCILGKDMKLDSSTMQSLLRMVSINNTAISSISGKTSLANGRIKLTTENYQFEQTEVVNGRTIKRRARRPMEFMEIDGKPYVYLSIIENRTNNEHAGRFYELNGINITDDKHIFFTIKDRSLVTLPNEPANSRVVEIPYAAKDFVEKLATNEKIVFSKNSLEANATLSNKTYGRRAYNDGVAQAWDNKDFSSEVYNYDSAGFVRHDDAESVLRKDKAKETEPNIEPEPQPENTEEQAEMSVPYENTWQNTYNSDDSAIVSENSADNSSETTTQNLTKNNNADYQNAKFEDFNLVSESEATSDISLNENNNSTAGDSEQPLVDTDGTGDEGNPTPEPAPQSEHQPAPEPQPEPEPVPKQPQEPQTEHEPAHDQNTPADGGGNPTAPQEEEEIETPKKKSALDIPFIENKEIGKLDKDAQAKSNEIAAKVGAGILGVGVVLMAFSVIIPFLAPFVIAAFATSTIVFTKPWEWVQVSKSNAIDRANAKLAKEKLKELKRERIEENERLIIDKNQQRIAALQNENAGIDARINMLETRKSELQKQNGILYMSADSGEDVLPDIKLKNPKTLGELETMSKADRRAYETHFAALLSLGITDETNMTEEQEKQLEFLERSMKRDYSLSSDSRIAAAHREDLVTIMAALQEKNIALDSAQKQFDEKSLDYENELKIATELANDPNVVNYIKYKDEREKVTNELKTIKLDSSLAPEVYKTLLDRKTKLDEQAADYKKKIDNLFADEKTGKQITDYLTSTDKLVDLDKEKNTSEEALKTLKAEINDLALKGEIAKTIFINDKMAEAHKNDKPILIEEQRKAAIRTNSGIIQSIDNQISELKKIQTQNNKLSDKIFEKSKKDYEEQTTRRKEKGDEAYTASRVLTENVDEYLRTSTTSAAVQAEQDYIKAQQEEQKQMAELFNQEINKLKQEGITGDELTERLEKLFSVHFNIAERSSPEPFKPVWENMEQQTRKEFNYPREQENTGKQIVEPATDKDAVKA